VDRHRRRALVIAVPLGLAVVVAPRAGLLFSDGNTLNALFLVSGLAGGFAAGILSSGGARAGFGSGLLAGVFGLAAIALGMILISSGSAGFAAGLWPIAVMILSFWVLPFAVMGGALGGSFGKSSGPSQASPEREL